MEKTFLKIDLSNSPWDSAYFRLKVIGTKGVIYDLMENGTSDSKRINDAILFLSHLENAVKLVNGCTPADHVAFPKIENARELVKSFLPEDFYWLPEYSQVAEELDQSASLGSGLFFYGGSGRGMTTILLGLCRWFKDNKYPYTFASHYASETNNFMDIFPEGAIIIDNIDDAYNHPFLDEVIDRIEKSRGKYRLFAASRLSAKGFVNKYGPRCASIFNAVCSRIEFKGESLREKVDLNW